MSKITTAILYFNKPTMTLRCLASAREALAEQQPSNLVHELLLIDNGSQAREPVAKADKYVRLDPNQGFGRGMNAGLREAFANRATRAVVLLSNDVELDRRFYAALAASLIKHENRPLILCPHVYYLSDRSKPAYTHGKLALPSFELSHHFDTRIKEMRFPLYYPAAATVWTRAAFDLCGGFNERYFCYWEDVELSHRCERLGISLVSAPELKIHHLGRGTTGGKRGYSEHFERGKELTKKILEKSD